VGLQQAGQEQARWAMGQAEAAPSPGLGGGQTEICCVCWAVRMLWVRNHVSVGVYKSTRPVWVSVSIVGVHACGCVECVLLALVPGLQ
jgi:hypothetical protein